MWESKVSELESKYSDWVDTVMSSLSEQIKERASEVRSVSDQNVWVTWVCEQCEWSSKLMESVGRVSGLMRKRELEESECL